jgi:DNA mismatch repair protein MutL
MKINLLADEVASQIAAGEVVERPASAVKELLENAIDAGATRISIRVAGAGQRLIEVSDNGSGIAPEDIELAVARHATSKLKQAEDLFHIGTLGFRGEALASIASVSHFVLTSRTKDQTSGARIVIDGGKVASVEQSGVPVGTVVTVRELFYNTPARLKFLKKEQTERQQIDGLITRYALAYPKIAFSLEQEEKLILHSSGNGDRREVLSQLYGADLARQMLAVEFEDGEVEINGFISPISLTRSNRRELTFFINGRWIQDSMLSSALLRAYQTFLMVGRYPVSILFIQLPAEEIDVNVHPAKAEVRFRHPDQMFALVQRAVRRGLLAFSPVPQISVNNWKTDLTVEPRQLDWNNQAIFSEPQMVPQETVGESAEPTTSAPVEGMRPSVSIPLLRWVGQIGGTYLIAEGPDGLYLIDQHAAHERVLFEKFMTKQSSYDSQALLEPLVFQVTPQAAHLLGESLPILQGIGFQVEEFGSNTFRISAVPALFTGGDAVAAVRSVVEEFEEDETPLAGQIEAKLVARICKRMAVKGGQLLSSEEQRQLVQDLEACISPRTCPHGRPTMIHLSVDLLERQFGRRGARSM